MSHAFCGSLLTFRMLCTTQRYMLSTKMHSSSAHSFSATSAGSWKNLRIVVLLAFLSARDYAPELRYMQIPRRLPREMACLSHRGIWAGLRTARRWASGKCMARRESYGAPKTIEITRRITRAKDIFNSVSPSFLMFHPTARRVA